MANLLTTTRVWDIKMQQRPQFVPRRQERFDARPRNKGYVPKQPDRRAPAKYIGPEVKLFCGHWVPEATFEAGVRKYDLRCPKCGTSWRGSMVINNRKSQAKKELWEAIRRAHEKTKEVYSAPKKPRK